MLFLAGALVRLVPGRDDAPRQLLQPGQSAERPHPFLGALAVHQVGRLVARRAGPSQHEQVLAVPGSQGFADFMPEVGVHGRESLDLLGGARDVDRRGEQLPLEVPEEEHLDALIFGPLDAAEVRLIRGAVHLGMAVGVDRSPVLGHHGMPQSPADAARLARFPRLHRHLGDPGGEELRVLRRLHDAVLGDLVIPFLLDGRRVGVRGVEHQFLDVEVGETVLHAPADLLENAGVDRDQVARDHDRPIEDLVALPGFQGQGRRRHRTLDVAGDPGVHLTGQRHRPIGRDAHGRAPDVELGGPAFRKCGGRQEGGDGRDRERGTTELRCRHSWGPRRGHRRKIAGWFRKESLPGPAEDAKRGNSPRQFTV